MLDCLLAARAQVSKKQRAKRTNFRKEPGQIKKGLKLEKNSGKLDNSLVEQRAQIREALKKLVKFREKS